MFRIVLAGILLAFAAGAAENHKLFVECNREELAWAVPELAGMQFDFDQGNLDGLLQASGENLQSMFAKLVDISAAEDVNEMRFEEDVAGESRREAFRYGMKSFPPGGPARLEEFRVDAKTEAPVHPPATIEFLLVSHFLELLDYFLPKYREQSRFRYLGRQNAGGQDYSLVAFAQRPEGNELRSNIQVGSNGQTAHMQGLAWIDAGKRIVRIRVDMLGPVEHFALETLAMDISMVPVNFKSIGSTFTLPARVTVDARFAGGELHSVHRYSDYLAENEKSTGIAAVTTPSGDDAYELVARGIALIKNGKDADAIPALREAVRVNGEMPAAHYNLANALRATGDMAGAEAESREAVKLVPDSGITHNLLGIVLSKRGNLSGAVDEFRKSAQLQPKQPVAHFNLAQALEKAGDRTGALEEYRIASELAPDNAAFKTRYQQLEHAANSETTIKVDVRQVLVPVIVTDRDGHHVTGLTRADFRVFEDGVEQKISGFSVENAGTGVLAAATDAAVEPSGASLPTPVQPAAPKPAPVRRTYVICIDSLHSGFANLVTVRQALLKLFHAEQPGDAQYIMLAIGTTTQLLQNTTTDPEKVLHAIESKEFQKLFLASRKSSLQDNLTAYRQKLDEVRAACDAGDPMCQMKSSLPSGASAIAAEDRVYNMAFLSQFQSMVQQLSRATDRRTVVLISDGFGLVPGKEAFALLVAYFPEFGSYGLRTVDRMPDLDPILRLAANRNVPIYTIDSRGLYTSPFFDASNPGGSAKMMPAVQNIMESNASDAGDTLSEIASATGGTAFQNRNDLLTGMQRAFADGRQYYMLAYVSGNSNADGKFRSISVRLRDGKMLVKAKRGYWAVAN
ncbi:MAG: VWA domain-containing protein [Bryobacteraceae bacterium]